MKRIRLNPSVFKVSKPGFDVDVASFPNLSLDMSSKVCGVYMTAKVTGNSNQPGGRYLWNFPPLSTMPFVYVAAKRTINTPYLLPSRISGGVNFSYDWNNGQVKILFLENFTHVDFNAHIVVFHIRGD